MKKSTSLLWTLIGLVSAGAPGPSSAEVLHRFAVVGERNPQGGLVQDATGALYGTTYLGGPPGQTRPSGTVFKLTPPAAGSNVWTEQLLYAFPMATIDGANPLGTLTPGPSGTLYGTTFSGFGGAGSGIIFELRPPTDGADVWIETILHKFTYDDGSEPVGDMITDTSGALYGVTRYGGPYQFGTVFKLSPPSGGLGRWTLETLYGFGQAAGVGSLPVGKLAMDAAGNLYGVTENGSGVVSYGTVFELSPPPAGGAGWNQKVLFNFVDQRDGQTPEAGLAIDAAGVLYGTTVYGGSSTRCRAGCGTVFTLTPPAAGSGSTWAHHVIHDFQDADGSNPAATPAVDKAGNVYGTTQAGGKKNALCFDSGCGTAYKLTPPAIAGSSWTLTAYIPKDPTQGSMPVAGLLLSPDGWAYGTAAYGGDPLLQSQGAGTVFRLRQ